MNLPSVAYTYGHITLAQRNEGDALARQFALDLDGGVSLSVAADKAAAVNTFLLNVCANKLRRVHRATETAAKEKAAEVPLLKP